MEKQNKILGMILKVMIGIIILMAGAYIHYNTVAMVEMVKEERKEKSETKSSEENDFFLSYHYGITGGTSYEYEITIGKNGAFTLIASTTPGKEDRIEKVLTNKEISDLERAVKESGVTEWNGFSGKTAGGEGTKWFSITYRNGTENISAEGYGELPDGYEQAHAILETCLKELAEESTTIPSSENTSQ